MAITPAQIDAMPDYTSAQMLKLWRKAQVDVATAGTSTVFNGRTLVRSDAEEIRKQIVFWQGQAIQDANPGQGMTSLSQFNPPQAGL